MFDGVVELFDPFGEEAPAPPELLEVLAASGVERVDLARRTLLGRDLLDVGEAALLDPDEEGVDGALDDVGEASLAQPSRDLVAVRRPHGQEREDDALESALEHLCHLLGHDDLPVATWCC